MAKGALAFMLVALLVAGCGKGDNAGSSDDSARPTIRNAPQWTEQDIIKAADLTPNDGGLSYRSPACDQIAVILTSAAQVNTYAGAGNTVVTNPDGNAGVKVIGADAACLAELERGLAKLTR